MKAVVITGFSTGIGLAPATLLAGHGLKGFGRFRQATGYEGVRHPPRPRAWRRGGRGRGKHRV